METTCWMGGGGFMMIFWWVAIIAAIILMINFATSNKTVPRGDESALEILNKRYASGEITEEEYKRLKENLLKP